MPIRPRGDAAGRIDVGDGTWKPDLTERVADRAVDIVARHIPNLRDSIVGRAVITPDDIAAYNQLGAGTWPGHGINGGSGYIVAQHLLQAANA
jgi:phytoene dehydrogenase-like protein